MRLTLRTPLAAALTLLVACGTTPEPARPAPPSPTEASEPLPLDLRGWHVAEGENGVHTVAWRAADPADRGSNGGVPRNREFTMELLVLREGVPASVDHVHLRGWMPDHDHGLVRGPTVREVSAGSYLVEGMLLHMRGSWELHFELVHGTTLEIATYEIEL